MVSAWLGGLGAGLLATFLSTAIAAKFWMPTVLAGPDLAALLIFVLTGTFISVLNEAWRREQVSVLRSQQHLRTTLSSIGDAVIATDAAGRITRLNPVAEELTGWRAADATGHAIEDVFVIFNEDSGEPAENPVRRVLKEGVIQDFSRKVLFRICRTIPSLFQKTGAAFLSTTGRLRSGK
jgi:PAS domain-containing protein